MDFDEYISEIPPAKTIYTQVNNIAKNAGLSLQQKINRLFNVGIYYKGVQAITAAVMNKVHTIMVNAKLTDQQKINQLNKLGFHYAGAMPTTAAVVTDAAVTDATVTDATTTETGGFPWKWVLIGGAGIAAIYFLKKK